ncbi:MAG: M20/M25/M40 family metallo-hydrolase [bacterium]|nr:M20/M25/M40 family metallo-hydrolase [bacterium]
MINKKRLVDEFIELVKIGSPSKSEGKICKVVAQKLTRLGAKTELGPVGKKFGSNGSNVIARIEGKKGVAPVLLNAHLDTVGEDFNITPIISNGIIKSDGTTILGSDDKSGVAIILEIIKIFKEQKIPHPPIEIVFTICEEIGLFGAKTVDFSKIKAKYGYSLDTGEIENITTAAPSHNRIYLKIFGVESHAGAAPELGISAIEVASKAIASLKLGRIDKISTSNIGKIYGGVATNIIPGYTEIAGEARSHSEEKLKKITQDMLKKFREAVEESEKTVKGKKIIARLEEKVVNEYSKFALSENLPVVQKIIKAGKKLGKNITTLQGGGGSDANVFNKAGIQTAVVGTGMKKVHTKEEYIEIDSLVFSANLLLEALRLN